MLKISSRAFAIIAAYLRNDLDGVLALVGYGDAELLPIVVEIPTAWNPSGSYPVINSQLVWKACFPYLQRDYATVVNDHQRCDRPHDASLCQSAFVTTQRGSSLVK
jgi:hypothetical protein